MRPASSFHIYNSKICFRLSFLRIAFEIKFGVKLILSFANPCAARLSGLPPSKVRSEGRTSCSSVLQALILQPILEQLSPEPIGSGDFFNDILRENHHTFFYFTASGYSVLFTTPKSTCFVQMAHQKTFI